MKDENWQDLAKENLPTQSGFCFGDVEYDEWYIKDIEDTVDILERVLAETDFENETILYSSSW